MNEMIEKSLWTKLISMFWEPCTIFMSLSIKSFCLDIIIPLLLVSVISKSLFGL